MVNISKLWVTLNIRQQFCLQSYDHGTLKIIMLQDYGFRRVLDKVNYLK